MPEQAKSKPFISPASLLVAVVAWLVFYWLASLIHDRFDLGEQQAAIRRAPQGAIMVAVFLHYGLSKSISASAALATMGVILDLVLGLEILLGSGGE
jgi:hypothetical protein